VVLSWTDIEPAEAVNIVLYRRVDIRAPRNENGEPCPWPWEPQQFDGQPIGQFHCSYCGGMQMAGLPHLDWSSLDIWRMEHMCLCTCSPRSHGPNGCTTDGCTCESPR
jgi:hypothetical protein